MIINNIAVCVFIRDRNNGKVLAVSRKTDHSKFGLPGGKVESYDQSLKHAAARELQEETGLIINNLADLLLIFHRVCNGEKDFDTFTFLLDKDNCCGEICTAENILVEWVDEEKLINGPFGVYNIALFDTYKRLCNVINEKDHKE